MTHLEGLSYAVFVVYLFSFFALSSVAARKAGRSVWLFAEGPALQRLSALLFRVAFALGALWPLVQAFQFDTWGVDVIRSALDTTIADLVGHLLVTIGACIAIIGQLHMGGSWRIGTALGQVGPIVDTGPFAVSRNPVFLGQVLLFAGLFLVFPGTVQACLFLALFIAIHMQVRLEERVLSASLGDPYRVYMRRVRRWLGTYSETA